MATRLVIEGGIPLRGLVEVSAAKNAALPALCATLLTAEPVVLDNVPRPRRRRHHALAARRDSAPRSAPRRPAATPSACRGSLSHEAPYELVKTMRASILVLGPAARALGEARVSLPGGCAIGVAARRPAHQGPAGDGRRRSRRARLHRRARRRAGCKGARITTDMVTVTGTENLMMAAALAEGETVLENAAREPEVADLAELLIAMGARIDGAGTEPHRDPGRRRGCTAPQPPHHPRPHRGRHLPGARSRPPAATCVLRGARADHLDAGARQAARGRRRDRAPATADPRAAAASAPARGRLQHQPVPGFPDRHAGAVHGARLRSPRARPRSPRRSSRTASCTSPSCAGWARDIDVDGNTARRCTASTRLSGRHRDGHRPARLGVASCIAGLVARRRDRRVDRIYHLDRGYERMEAKLAPWRRRRSSGPVIDDRSRSRCPRAASRAALPLLGALGRRAASTPDTRAAAPRRPGSDLRVILLVPADVPTYVEHGAADLGIVGNDMLLEHGSARSTSRSTSGFALLPARGGRAARALTTRRRRAKGRGSASPPSIRASPSGTSPSEGIHVDLIKLYGSIELAPLAGLAERIVDLVQSGETLRANGLVEVAEIITSRRG